MQIGMAKQRYELLVTARDPFLKRARACATLTIPSLLPPEGHGSTSDLPTPYQGIGARGLNNIASKLLLSLLPPNTPFFKLAIDDFALQDLTQAEGMRAKVEEALASIERSVTSEIETTAIRPPAFELFKHLANGGNVMPCMLPDGGMKVYRLDSYVVRRDPVGNVLEIVVHEKIDPTVLPPDVAAAVNASNANRPDKTVDLYTHIFREPRKWVVYQQACDIVIQKSKGTYPLKRLPWFPLRWTRIDGEDYGRGLVEEYFGDLSSLEVLMQAIVEGSAAASRVLVMVNPNGSTSEEDVSKAANGATITGNSEDVSMLQMEKFNDFRVTMETVNILTQRLEFAFLLNTSIQRKGERVTAEEIRFMAGELEDALGGLYSLMSQEFQLPLVTNLMHRMERQGRLPSLPEGTVRPAIVTGFEALGRGHDVQKLQTFVGLAGQLLGPEIVLRYVNGSDLMKRLGTGLGIDMKGLIRTDEQIAAAEQQAQMQQMMAQLGPNAVNQLGGMAQTAMQQQAPAAAAQP